MKASAGSALSSIGGPLGSLTSAAGGAGKALGIAAAGAGAFAAVKLAEFAKDAADEWVNLAAQVRDFQRASGASADEASRWVAVLDDMGLAADTGGKAAFKLGKEIDNGGEKLKAFGIEVATNEDGSRNLTETLLNVADAYTETEDPATKAALAQAAFGKAGLNLIPILEQGRKGSQGVFRASRRRPPDIHAGRPRPGPAVRARGRQPRRHACAGSRCKWARRRRRRSPSSRTACRTR